MERKGLLLPDQEDFVSDILLGMLKPKNKFVALALKMFGRKPVRLLDDQILDKISVTWKSPLISIVDAIISQDYSLAEKKIADLMNKKLDVPGLNEEVEQQLMESSVKFIASALKYFIAEQKKKLALK